MLRSSMKTEFSDLKDVAKRRPAYAAATQEYQDSLLCAVDANAAALEQLYGPEPAGLMHRVALAWGSSDEYSSLGSVLRHVAKVARGERELCV
jgi:hypothetical protein